MSNMNNNRVNQVLTEEQMTNLKEGIKSLEKDFSFFVGLTDQERASLLGIDVNNKAFVEDALNAGRVNQDLLPRYLSLESAELDLKLFEQMDEIITIVEQFHQKLSDTRLLAGSEAYMTALMLYRLFIAASTAGMPGADAAVKKLEPRFKKQGERAPKPGTATE